VTVTFSDARVGSTADDGSVGVDSTGGPRADRPRRRSFTPEYKAAIVAEYDALSEPGGHCHIN
jgi:hypothetical protein